MNIVLLTEGTGQGVHGRKTNVGRLYDLLVENGNQRINLEAGPGTHAFRHLGGRSSARMRYPSSTTTRTGS